MKQKPKRKTAPEGKSWCSGHMEFLAVELFHRDGSWHLQRHCKDCHRAYMAAWRRTVKAEKPAHRAYHRRDISVGPRPAPLEALARKYANR